MSAAIGRDTPVTYLAYGTVNYYMRNPTECRYPSALWLLVGTGTASAAANRACLDTGGWIVVQPSWFGVVDCEERIEAGPFYACPPGSWSVADLPSPS